MVVIPWKKMEQRMFGINQRGIFSVDQSTSKVSYEEIESSVCVCMSAYTRVVAS